MIYIYGLVERNAEVKGIRYIGLTGNPQSRLIAHRESTEENSKAAWVNELALSGSTIDMVILDQAESRDDAHRLEASWIKFAESKGWELTNTIRPSGEYMTLPDGDHASQPSAQGDFIWRIFDNSTRIQNQIYDLRNDISLIKSSLARPASLPPAPEQAKSSRRNALVGAYRQCMIGAILLLVAQCVSIFNSIAGVDGQYIVWALMMVAFLMWIYPIAFMLKLVVLWLFGCQLEVLHEERQGNRRVVTVNGRHEEYLAGKLT